LFKNDQLSEFLGEGADMTDLGHVERWKTISREFRRHIEGIKADRTAHTVITTSYTDADSGETFVRKICAACQLTWIPGHDDAVVHAWAK
jgi:hypothetical protein